MVATGYDTPHGALSRPLQFLRLHLWEASCANVTCPSAMQDGAARLLQQHIRGADFARLPEDQRRVFQDAFRRLTSRDPAAAWTSGQWMTERSGGSDVSLTETTAVHAPSRGRPGLADKHEQLPLGPWSISGFKWFSSATDSGMTVLLAKTAAGGGSGGGGGGGLSAFLAPMRRHDPSATTLAGLPDPDGTRLNGVRIQRLKSKHGTRPLPTAELVLEDMRGWLVGREGGGVREISTVLTLTRVHSAVAAVGCAGRALGVARAYARDREIGAGRGARVRLADSPLHMRTLAGMSAEYRGLMLLTFFTTYVLGLSEHPDAALDGRSAALTALTPPPACIAPLLRVLTQLTKAYVCKAGVPLVFSCMEALGGVGYLENEEQEYLNISRLYRDVSVLPIWEGTTDVLSTDFVRALKHPKGGEASLDAIGDLVRSASAFKGDIAEPEDWRPVSRWETLRARIVSTPQAELMGEARAVLWSVADILVSLLLFVDASAEGSGPERDIFQQFIEAKYGVVQAGQKMGASEELRRDRAIVYGRADGAPSSKL